MKNEERKEWKDGKRKERKKESKQKMVKRQSPGEEVSCFLWLRSCIRGR